MGFINLLVAEQTGFWANIINAFVDFVSDYAWAIILLTIVIKLVLTPLDFLRQKSSRDNIRVQMIIGPQLQKLQKQYANDKSMLNQKTMELYKANNFNIMGMCLPMLITMIVTLVIFLTLFGALTSMASFKLEEQYLTLKNTYEEEYEINSNEEEAEKAVLEKYDEIKNSFLWVNNIWVADTPWTKSILDFESYIGIVKSVRVTSDENKVFSDLSDEEKETYKMEYNKVMGILLEKKNSPNGYFVTAILAIAISFLAQYLMQRRMMTKRTQNEQIETQQKTNKLLLIILPIIMGFFTLFYSSIFGLYIIAGQMVSMLTLPLIDKILDRYYEKKNKEAEKKNKVSYSRK